MLLAVGKVFAADRQATVVMLTWRGNTAAEIAFLGTLGASGRDIEIIQFDAGRERRALGNYLRKNKDILRNSDAVYTFGTLTARTLKSFDLRGVPHVFNIVADPVGTGLVDSLEKPGPDRTGAKNTVPLGPVFAKLSEAIDFSDVAVLFDPRELTSEAQVAQVVAAVEKLGKTGRGVRFVPDGGHLEEQLIQMTVELAGADLVYIPAASSFVGKTRLIAQVSPRDAVVVGAIEAFVGEGATIAVATDYSERGTVAAEIVLSILDGVSPRDIPVSEVAIEEAVIVIDTDDPRSARISLDALNGNLKLLN